MVSKGHQLKIMEARYVQRMDRSQKRRTAGNLMLSSLLRTGARATRKVLMATVKQAWILQSVNVCCGLDTLVACAYPHNVKGPKANVAALCIWVISDGPREDDGADKGDDSSEDATESLDTRTTWRDEVHGCGVGPDVQMV